MSKNGLTYADAGVNIDEGDRLVDLIKPLAKATRRLGADGSIGGFGGAFDLKAAGFKDPVLISGTDGVGTKLRIAIDTGILNTCLLYTSPSPRDQRGSRMPSSA